MLYDTPSSGRNSGPRPDDAGPDTGRSHFGRLSLNLRPRHHRHATARTEQPRPIVDHPAQRRRQVRSGRPAPAGQQPTLEPASRSVWSCAAGWPAPAPGHRGPGHQLRRSRSTIRTRPAAACSVRLGPPPALGPVLDTALTGPGPSLRWSALDSMLGLAHVAGNAAVQRSPVRSGPPCTGPARLIRSTRCLRAVRIATTFAPVQLTCCAEVMVSTSRLPIGMCGPGPATAGAG